MVLKMFHRLLLQNFHNCNFKHGRTTSNCQQKTGRAANVVKNMFFFPQNLKKYYKKQSLNMFSICIYNIYSTQYIKVYHANAYRRGLVDFSIHPNEMKL